MKRVICGIVEHSVSVFDCFVDYLLVVISRSILFSFAEDVVQ